MPASIYRNRLFYGGPTYSYIMLLRSALLFVQHKPALVEAITEALRSYDAKEDAPHEFVFKNLWHGEVWDALSDLAMYDCYFGWNRQTGQLGWWVAEQ